MKMTLLGAVFRASWPGFSPVFAADLLDATHAKAPGR